MLRRGWQRFWHWLLRLFRRRIRVKPSGWQRTRHGGVIRRARKPAWVIDELVRLKALMPKAGCRQLTDTFNRLHARRRQMTVSKSFVAYTLCREQYAIECRRRALRRREPYSPERNAVWALDMTGKQDVHGEQHAIFGLIDHGTRRLLRLENLTNKNAWTLLGHLFLAIGRYGRPAAIRTDNERVFTGKVFSGVVRLAGIRYQRTDRGCPWQNGRIERLFGTLKAKLDQWRVLDGGQLQAALQTFHFWYNAVRPHQKLNGRTPLEVWNGVDPYRRALKRVEWFEAWDGLLSGFYLSG
ncbi:integrase core domain-containing protein [Pseudomonas sp. SCB32]|uniref:integrase core domain-containing protein n=1 Tax=Pseudomonas sp. SCB32 TaxID=2653853 RepID=UPI001264C748|nr:integrase core domain-containing protein [Pseudomonas sp. SCB32]